MQLLILAALPLIGFSAVIKPRGLIDQLSYYETVSFKHGHVSSQHQRLRRSPLQQTVLSFRAFDRDFSLVLRRDVNVFHDDVVIEDTSGQVHFDTDRVVNGIISDERNSKVYGVLTSRGTFQGKLHSANDTFSLEDAHLHFTDPTFHSVIYKHSHLLNTPTDSQCRGDEVHRQLRHEQYQTTKRKRHKRQTINPLKTTCLLYMQADHLFYQRFGTAEKIIEQLSEHVQAANSIFNLLDLDGDGSADNIGFMIKRIKLWPDSTAADYKFPASYDVSTYLERFSIDNFDDFCLAYMFTYRDFNGGTLGLAWTGDLTVAGGVCERHGYYKSQWMSLNAGIVTMINYGLEISTTVSHVTFAHELGHNLGSQHDPANTDPSCSPGGSNGNYIMYPSATSGHKANNNQFSNCSKAYMSPIVASEARDTSNGCFIARPVAVCGNGVQEVGEQCDCGWTDMCNDTCCIAQNGTNADACQLTANANCSSYNDVCCDGSTCQPYTANTHICIQNSSCNAASYCDSSGLCPAAVQKADRTVCGTMTVCLNGECSLEVCEAYGLELCQCSSTTNDWSDPVLCHLCCQTINGSNCKSASAWRADFTFQYHSTFPQWNARPGSACNDYKGYCDVFDVCREIDATGPLTALRNAFFSAEARESIVNFLSTKWYIPTMGLILLIGGMTLFVKFCGKSIPKMSERVRKTRSVTPQKDPPPKTERRKSPSPEPPQRMESIDLSIVTTHRPRAQDRFKRKPPPQKNTVAAAWI